MARRRRLSKPQEEENVAEPPPQEQDEEDVEEYQPSLLSSERFNIREAPVSMRGGVNLIFFTFILNNVKSFFRNFKRYGVQIRLDHLQPSTDNWPAASIALLLTVFPLIQFYVERSAATHRINEKAARVLATVNLVLCATVPMALIWNFRPNPVSGVMVGTLTTCMFMKLVSYAVENKQLRSIWRAQHGEKHGKEVCYPQNVTLQNMLYFLAIPTFCYKLKNPRGPRKPRYGMVLRWFVEGLILLTLIFVIAEQYLKPVADEAVIAWADWVMPDTAVPERETSLVSKIIQLLRMAPPNMYIWILGFFVMFHFFLNITAELTRYGDRVFYKDWWNACTTEHFWRTWNIPVHQWINHYVYMPLLNRRLSRNASALVSFFVSALAHEMLISIPFHTIKWWAFAGIMGQIPLGLFTRHFMGNRMVIGNLFLWLTLMVGQPFLILMYMIDYAKNQELERRVM